MAGEGNIKNPWGRIEQMLASMSDWYTWGALSISGETTTVTDGYLVVKDKWPGCVCKGFINTSSSAGVAVIAKTRLGDEATINIAASSKIDKLPAITHIKKDGTGDGLVCLLQYTGE